MHLYPKLRFTPFFSNLPYHRALKPCFRRRVLCRQDICPSCCRGNLISFEVISCIQEMCKENIGIERSVLQLWIWNCHNSSWYDDLVNSPFKSKSCKPIDFVRFQVWQSNDQVSPSKLPCWLFHTTMGFKNLMPENFVWVAGHQSVSLLFFLRKDQKISFYPLYRSVPLII